ncbi:MAG: peptidoglycan DD-metalloendopeptidase family protein [Pseudomonadota bacterium]
MLPPKNLERSGSHVNPCLIPPRWLLVIVLATACLLHSAYSGAAGISGHSDINWVTSVVKSGDTLSSIADKYNISPSELHRIVYSDQAAKKLAHLRPGDEIKFGFDTEDHVLHVSKQLDEETRLTVERTDQGFVATEVSDPLERRIHYASGIIEHSLFGAANEAGVSSSVIMGMAGLFGWDVDFGLDVRSGDQFSIVYEQLYRNGEFVRDGDIIAAEFINTGSLFRALRYTDPKGNTDYYTPKGETLRKAFLRSPVDFARISSGFNLKRMHPVLHKIRAHKGVDYAAKTGTPVRTTGDGKVIHRGRKGGYGKTIIIQHGSRYSTLYAHLSKYAGKARVGSRVNQGDIIGYVGSTGLSTGPHLHYEFRADGVHRNPLRFKFPGVAPVADEYRDDFHRKTASLIAQLDTISRSRLALAESE